MKKIECYVRKEDVPPLVQALSKAGVGGLTVYPVRGFGHQKGNGSSRLLPKMKIEVLVLGIETDRIIETIMQVTRRGEFGDGKIVISPVDDIIRIRTGEKGARAVF